MRGVLVVLMWSAAACCLAQSIHAYKSVHADGTVTYSDTRPATAASVREINIYQNSAAIEQQGKRRMQEMDAISEGLEKQRADETQAKRKYETRLAEARQEVADAVRNLVAAQQSKKSATAERIGLAQARVRLARQRLREV
ncbi:MAG: DUF4124 domain-containing protein, partial [Hyphomicrobium sp.]